MSKRYLGSATVTRSVGERIEVRCDELGAGIQAQSALAYPYQPVRGDELLVLGDADELFIIGVLKGRGKPKLEGERVTLHAGGNLRLSGGRGVAMTSRKADLVAHEDIALQSHFARRETGQLRQRVLDKIETLSRDYDQVVEKGWVHHARSITAKVKKTFYINGGRIYLS